MRALRRGIGAALAVASLSLIAVDATGAPREGGGAEAALAMPGFLAGSWCSNDGSTEELWMVEKAGLMLGLNRSVGRGGKAAFEYLRIERRDDGIFYLASPGGREATPFRLVESSPTLAAFENPQHDFPTRIAYELQGDGELRASIEGTVEGERRGAAWSFRGC